MRDKKSIDNIDYRGRYTRRNKINKKSLEVIGIDTEADTLGRCFMVSTSLGDTYDYNMFPRKLFGRKYLNKSFVAYNLKYDTGAFLQHLPKKYLRELWETDITEWGGYTYKVIGNKSLTIKRGKNCIHFYDMYNFYKGSLNYNAKKYLGEEKLKQDTTIYTKRYYKKHWDEIAKYCVQDAVLVKKLADLIIGKFEKFGVYPKQLYSTAFVSYKYFSTKCKYPIVKKFWDNDRDVLSKALKSYYGGKFEVTQKMSGMLYEYDIISAYPYEIANLVDIQNAIVVRDKKYHKEAEYGFMVCKCQIPPNIPSPIVVTRKQLNTYPSGEFVATMTKREYEYMTENGADITIVEAVWLYVHKKVYPFKHEIQKLVDYKQYYKSKGMELDTHTIKIFLNSLYGKFAQLIEEEDCWKANNCWNPIYGAVVTANVRTRISEYQRKYPSIIAVHTDSIISYKKLPVKKEGELGNMVFEVSGEGLILGCGVYQIGDKVRLRGFPTNCSLMEMLHTKKSSINFMSKTARTWREVAFRGWDTDMINRFEEVNRDLNVNFDRKRLWLDDYKSFDEIFRRDVLSTPLHYHEQFYT